MPRKTEAAKARPAAATRGGALRADSFFALFVAKDARVRVDAKAARRLTRRTALEENIFLEKNMTSAMYLHRYYDYIEYWYCTNEQVKTSRASDDSTLGSYSTVVPSINSVQSILHSTWHNTVFFTCAQYLNPKYGKCPNNASGNRQAPKKKGLMRLLVWKLFCGWRETREAMASGLEVKDTHTHRFGIDKSTETSSISITLFPNPKKSAQPKVSAMDQNVPCSLELSS